MHKSLYKIGKDSYIYIPIKFISYVKIKKIQFITIRSHTNARKSYEALVCFRCTSKAQSKTHYFRSEVETCSNSASRYVFGGFDNCDLLLSLLTNLAS